MERMDFAKICRVCLGEGTTMSLFKVSMFKKVMAIASIQVWPNDGLPGQICTRCASRLHIAFQLKKQCEKSDLKLRQYQAMMPQHKKFTEDIQTNIDIVAEPIPQQVQIEPPHRVFVQEADALVENIRTEQPTYNHFITVPHNQQIPHVTYTNLATADGQLQVPTYNMPAGHMIYNAQYALQHSHIDAGHQSQIIQLQINTPPPIEEDEKKIENIENSSTNEVKEGKACSTCGKVFRTNIKLNRHMKIHTTLPSELQHKCPVCGKGFSHGGNFKIHLRIHNNERPYKCPVCNRGCRQAQDLEKHMRTHTGERPHKCHYCPKAFATSSNLTAHIRTHTGERPYVCCVCQKAFCQSNELTKHMRTHTGEKSHICDICNKGFNGSSGLLAHRRQHTGERPYVCPQCNRGFTSSNCLSAHIKTHNKAAPMKCGECEQSFSSLSLLKDHITRDHNVGEVLQCKMCEKNFERVNDYLIHMRSHETVDS